MSIWWFIIVPLSFLWIIPMAGLHRIHASVWVFILNALLWCIVAVFAHPMYDWGTNIGRRLGHSRMVALRERIKSEILPPIRIGLIIMALISVIYAII